MQPRVIFALAALLGPSAPSLAQSANAPAAPSAQSQALARSTFIATMEQEFRKLDGNRDGTVTQAELASGQQRAAQSALEQPARAAFAGMDADHNGQISISEFLRANARPATRVNVSGMMGRLDSNGDQKVTVVEYHTLTLATFDRLDADKDGMVSAAEQRAAGIIK